MIQISFRIQGITFIPTTAQLHHVGEKDQRTTRYIIVREQRQSARIRNIWWTVFIYCKDGALCPTTGRCSVSTLYISHPHNADTRRATIFFLSPCWWSRAQLHGKRQRAENPHAQLHGKRQRAENPNAQLHGKCQHAENPNAQLHGKRQHAENPNAQLHGKRQRAEILNAKCTGSVSTLRI